jgi:hypothetical protein
MASILAAEDVVRRIAAQCVFVDERGAVGIRLKPAAAIVRLYGNQYQTPRGRLPHGSYTIPKRHDRAGHDVGTAIRRIHNLLTKNIA